MEESENSCCSPQRDGVSSGVERHKFAALGIHNELNFLTIPAGEFIMGTDDSFYPTDGESPSRSVWVDEFKISKFAVTNSEFAAFVNSTGYITEAETYGWSYVFNGFINEVTVSKQVKGVVSAAPWWLAIDGAHWFTPYGDSSTVENLLDHPVVHVTHNDALEFCKWSGYKLPTEAQWEKASRGGLVSNLYPWGNELFASDGHNTNIWQGEFPHLNTKDDGFFGTAPVNSFKPNKFGLYNTVGNVWEWTNDFWSARWHIQSTQQTRKNPLGPKKISGNKVLKGGSFLCHDSYCFRFRNSARTYNSPNTSTSHIGFRCII